MRNFQSKEILHQKVYIKRNINPESISIKILHLIHPCPICPVGLQFSSPGPNPTYIQNLRRPCLIPAPVSEFFFIFSQGPSPLSPPLSGRALWPHTHLTLTRHRTHGNFFSHFFHLRCKYVYVSKRRPVKIILYSQSKSRSRHLLKLSISIS